MTRHSWPWACASALLALSLAGCGRGAEGDATGSANAPGSPGAGNERVVARPMAPDTPPGGPSGVKGSLPHTGSSGGDAVAGTTGSGTAEEGGRSQPAQAGVGLGGGLGGDTSTMGAGVATEGSTNSGPGSRVGSR